MQSREKRYTAYNSYVSLLRTLKFDEDTIYDLSWSPDGKYLAAVGYGETVIFARADGSILPYSSPTDEGVLSSIAWSPNGRLLAMRYKHGVYVVDPEHPQKTTAVFEAELDPEGPVDWSPDGNFIAVLRPGGELDLWMQEQVRASRTLDLGLGSEQVLGLAWRPSSSCIAMRSTSGLALFDTKNGKTVATSRGEFGCIAWSPDGATLLAGGPGVLSVFDSRLRVTRRLEGHPGHIERVAASYDGRQYASGSANQLRIYRADRGDPVFIKRNSASRARSWNFAFDPTGPRIAVHTDDGLDILQYNPQAILTTDPAVPSVHYRNAKVVLVGNSGVGKSGLALRLSDQDFRATDSTHARQVYLLDSIEVPEKDGWTELRETYLWDLAGQPGYRLIHQLHLDEIAMALVLFDAGDALNPFGGVDYWARAIKQASSRRAGNASNPTMILVAARVDRGTVRVHKGRIDEYSARLGFGHYMETSSKEGKNITELLSLIKDQVHWNKLPQVSSTKLFHVIRQFLLQQQGSGRVLSTESELQRDFTVGYSGELEDVELPLQFETCLRLAHARGIVKKFSFGQLVLLRPELIDSYASALVESALSEPDGLGCIREDDARAGRFGVPSEDRVRDADTERLLCTAMVEELIRNEIALIEFTDKGQQLVFPSQATRENPDLPDPAGKAVVIEFAGSAERVYSTLVVRLTHSGQYQNKQTWRNATAFTANTGSVCGIYLHQKQEDKAELTLFFGPEASAETQFQFESYVMSHLQRRATADSLNRRRIYSCQHCNTRISDEQAYKRKQLGHKVINCNVCDRPVSLSDTLEIVGHAGRAVIAQMNAQADEHREFEAAVISASGEMQSEIFRKWAGSAKPTLAIVFTDVKGSTARQLEYGNRRWREIIGAHFAHGTTLVVRNDGYLVKTIGDSLMVAFHNAIDGLNFSLGFSVEPGHPVLSIRAALHVGLVDVMNNDAFGTMVNYAARMQSAISEPEIWLSAAAKQQIDEEKAPAHRSLAWWERRGVELKDFGHQDFWCTLRPRSKNSRQYRRR